MKKAKKYLCILIALLTITMPLFTVSASEPPFSETFDTYNDMAISLESYIEQFSAIERPGYHVEYKQVMLPQIISAKYSLTTCSYRETQWGSNVNYTVAEFQSEIESESIRVLTYYHLNSTLLQKWMTASMPSGVEVTAYEGVFNEISYYAYSYIRENGTPSCWYNMVIGNVFVTVIDCEAFDENRLGLLTLEETQYMLPVYVLDEGVPSTILGDVDNDGNVSINDVTTVQRYLAGRVPLSEEQLLNANVNGDSNVSIVDATLIQKYLAQLDYGSLPIGLLRE